MAVLLMFIRLREDRATSLSVLARTVLLRKDGF